MDAKIINYTEAKKLVAEGAQLIDVRTPEEYNETKVGGLNLPLDRVLEDFSLVLSEDKATPIVLFCRSGSRSKKAASLLRGLGYTELYDLESYKNWLG
jgi:phage shock protein E